MNIKDIAQKAGVSRSTVSRVLNNHRYVSEETRAKVLAVIEAENYNPNPSARALVTQRTYIVGVVIPHPFDVLFGDIFYHPLLLQGVSDTVQNNDYAMLLWLGQTDKDEEQLYKRILQNRLMDGLIIASAIVSPTLISKLELPFVMMERPVGVEDHHINYVNVDNIQAAQSIVEHLILAGRRRIGIITSRLETIPDALDRLEGYKRALRGARLPFDPDLVVEGRFDRPTGYMAMQVLLQYEDIDAVFAANDAMALGALDALAEAGKRVPDEVAVVGFDDIPPAATAGLTTVRQSFQQRGVKAASLLLDIIEGRVSGPRQILLPTQLVIRKTCGSSVL